MVEKKKSFHSYYYVIHIFFSIHRIFKWIVSWMHVNIWNHLCMADGCCCFIFLWTRHTSKCSQFKIDENIWMMENWPFFVFILHFKKYIHFHTSIFMVCTCYLIFAHVLHSVCTHTQIYFVAYWQATTTSIRTLAL